MGENRTPDINLDARHLAAVERTALFYPCCGADLELPLRLFASVVSDFYFVDIRLRARPRLLDLFEPSARPARAASDETLIHRNSGRLVQLHRWEERAETTLHRVPQLGVFFFRGDTLARGEGSSGVAWLGGELFPQILGKVISGGLIVTDGSNVGEGGPLPLQAFHRKREIGPSAVERAMPFDYKGRRFTCIAYVGEKNGPTLVWRVD